MIHDLASHEHDVSLTADVLIVGGGIAGLLLASKLVERSCRVVVIESGGLEQREDTHPLNDVVQLGHPYLGATHGRFRCLGGTSTRWGGALIPFLADDLLSRPYLNIPAWPVGIEAVLPYLADVESLFRVDHGSYEEGFAGAIGRGIASPADDTDFIARSAKWPTFKRRNVARLLKQKLNGSGGIDVWINATAAMFGLDEGSGRLQNITAIHPNGRRLTVTAAQHVFCAGAIETTRLLLLVDAQCRNRPFERCEALGHYFHDHISAPVASIRATDPIALNRLAGFRFVGSTMRSPRFEISPAAQRKYAVPSAYGHITFRPLGISGFDALRDFLRAMQRSGQFDHRSAMRILGDFPYLVRVAIWRVLYKQLCWPAPAEYALQVVGEQVGRHSNYVSLTSERDSLGMQRAAIHWQVSSEDRRVFEVYRRSFQEFWDQHGFGALGQLDWSISEGQEAEAVGMAYLAGGTYHPGGSTRMGHDPRSAVVDSDLKTFAIPNLWVASTSVFPAGASANPTLMLMLFTQRLAEHLPRYLVPR